MVGPGQPLNVEAREPGRHLADRAHRRGPSVQQAGPGGRLVAAPGLGFNVYGSLLADATNENGVVLPDGRERWASRSHVIAPGRASARPTSARSRAWRTRRIQPEAFQNRVWERYTVEQIGIGWDKADLYLISLEVGVVSRGRACG